MKQSLRVLITNSTLAGHRGARSVTRDLVLGLLEAGHRPALFSPQIGDFRNELRALSVPVSEDIASIMDPPDVIHAQHLPATTLAIARFPEAPAVFVCHDFMAWQDTPPRLPQIRRYAAISEGFLDRLVIEGGVPPAKARVVLNGVDMRRYPLGPRPGASPRRALAFAKNLGHLEAIQAVCAARGMELDIVGGAVRTVITTADALPNYDLVFASALTAMEAMATGRAVIVCDGRGLAGFVNRQRYPAWRRENFGLRTLLRPVSVANLAAELDLYSADEATDVAARVREEADLPGWIGAYTALYREAIDEHEREPLDPETRSIALAAHLQSWISSDGPGFPWLIERQALVREVKALRRQVQPAPPGDAT